MKATEPGKASDRRLPAAESTATPHVGMARLADRIGRWTTRLALSAIVVVIALGFGRQVLQWWAADDAPAEKPAELPANADGLGDPSRPHVIRFGDRPWTIARRTVTGSKADATAALQTQCREATIAGAPPTGPVEPTEAALLERLAGSKPAEAAGGRWQVHVLEHGLPMAVGLKPVETPGPAAPQLAEPPSRVVTWAVAVPSGDDAWALYSFQPEQDQQTEAGDPPDVPLPPAARPTLALRAVGGGAMIGFEGEVEPAACWRFYEGWFASHGWTRVGVWHHHDESWYGRFRKDDANTEQTADVRLGLDRQNRLSGLVVLSGKK